MGSKNRTRVWRAVQALAADRSGGVLVKKLGTFIRCRICGDEIEGTEYIGKGRSLMVADCYACGVSTRKLGHGGAAVVRTEEDRINYLYNPVSIRAGIKRAEAGVR